ncbi:hypothetical protein [Kitasatospora sp. LaBMicrA B282]|uniref:hypothetical protein n=1 Tax=Kitasatospora sp. LaBMicrA B282 TaxID=3420949 RepID=UPI003D14F709
MPLLVQPADNTEIDHQLRAEGLDPARALAMTPLDLADPRHADVFGMLLGVPWVSVIARSEQQSFDYGAPVGVGAAVTNSTPDVITRTIGGEVTVGTTKSFSVSSTVEADLFSVVKASVTVSYGQDWHRDETFKDYLEIPIQPGYTSWLQRETVMRRITGGDFFASIAGMDYYRFAGTITGPGVAGELQDRITVISRQLKAAQLTDVSEALGKHAVRRADGVTEIPAQVAALL